MTSREEIETIVYELLNRVPADDELYGWFRELFFKRGNLQSNLWNAGSPDEAEDLAIIVVQRVAQIQTCLIQETTLRSEEDLSIAVDIGIDAVIEYDYRIGTDGIPNLSDSS